MEVEWPQSVTIQINGSEGATVRDIIYINWSEGASFRDIIQINDSEETLSRVLFRLMEVKWPQSRTIFYLEKVDDQSQSLEKLCQGHPKHIFLIFWVIV